MKGRRLEVVTNPDTGRPDLNLCMPSEPGDYVGPIVGYNGSKPAVYFLKPNARDPDAPAAARGSPRLGDRGCACCGIFPHRTYAICDAGSGTGCCMNPGEGACACFWVEGTGMVRLWLRRFTFKVREGEAEGDRRGHRNCPATTWGHDASVALGIEIPLVIETAEDGWKHMGMVPDEHRPPHDDPRWPQVCAKCGQPFLDNDERQVNQNEVYRRPDTGEEMEIRGHGDSCVGALFDEWWLHGRRTNINGVEHRYVGPDGIALVAVCPNGMSWEIDGPSRDGGHWQRTGDPRRPETLSVSPSIVIGDYHGFLGSSGTPPGHFSGHLG